jgi:CRISPR-associated protein (TIGR03986 family)
MSKYKYSNQKFVNPYNFIPLQSGCKRETKDYKERKGNLTGWMECQLETLSPVFIPNTSSVYEELDKEKKDSNSVRKSSSVFQKILKDRIPNGVKVNSYDFFSYQSLENTHKPEPGLPEAPEPVITGSEIRGMIRTAFEAVTNSCLSTIDDEKVLYKRVTNIGNAGILKFENGNWKIQKCRKYRIAFESKGRDRKHFCSQIKTLSEGQPVYIKPGKNYKVLDIKLTETNGYLPGFFHKGEPFGKTKRHEAIFVIEDGNGSSDDNSIKITQREVKNYMENLKLYRDRTVNLHYKKEDHAGYEKIDINEIKKDINKLDGALVYYTNTEHNNRVYLSPAQIGREIFYNKLTEIVGNYTPCQTLNSLCPACALFGIAGKRDAAASRVRFTDAHVPEDKKLNDPALYYDEKVRILKELASPKLSAAEFYLKRDPKTADLWNYDYAFRWKRKHNGKVTNKMEMIKDYNPQIRGRKFYWHHLNVNPYIEEKDEINPEVVSERNVAVRPLKKGNVFKFKIYFNHITADELKKLLWVLEIGGRNKTQAHKLGMGKPLGLGSASVTVNHIFRREIILENDTVEYRITPYEKPDLKTLAPHQLGCSQKVWDDFLMITDLNHRFDNIEYPNNIDKPQNFHWFAANKQISKGDGLPELKEYEGRGGTGTSPIIEQTLPPIKSSPWLYKYKEKNQ